MRSNLPDFSSQCSNLTACQVPTMVTGHPVWWWVGLATLAYSDRNDHQPSGSSYVGDTALF